MQLNKSERDSEHAKFVRDQWNQEIDPHKEPLTKEDYIAIVISTIVCIAIVVLFAGGITWLESLRGTHP